MIAGAPARRGEPLKVWIAVGETSGDRLGAALVRRLAADRPVIVRGMGGPALQEAGLQAVAHAEEATALGLAEVVGDLGRLRRLLGRLNDEALRFEPHVAVTIDSPGLLLRHARALKARGIPVAHWVAPQVWAWRPGRARRLAQAVDTLLCLLPFEPPLFLRHGVRAVFTGHPAADRERARSGPPGVVLAPGSRPGEIARLTRALNQVAERITCAWPDVEVRVPVAPSVGEVALPGRRYASVDEAAIGAIGAVVASGTVTVELAALGVPMVAVYAVHPLTWSLAKRLVRVPHVALPNVILGDRVVPEHLQRLDPEALWTDLQRLRGPDGARQRAALAEVTRQLQGAGAVNRAAAEVLRLVRSGGRSGPRARSLRG